MLERFELTDRQPRRHDSPPQQDSTQLDMPASLPAEAAGFPSENGLVPAVTASLDRSTVLKLDIVLLPFVSLLFLLNSLDKSNVGNAETANFTRDAGLQPEDLNTAVACFFAFFVALQPVGAAVGRRYGMAKVVPTCMALWGLCTAAHVLVRKKWQLIALRVFIGTLEGVFDPTSILCSRYSTSWALEPMLDALMFASVGKVSTTPSPALRGTRAY